MAIFQRALAWYQDKLVTAPLVTNCISCAGLLGAGDIIQQNIERMDGSEDGFHIARLSRMCTIGLVWVGPSSHYVYKYLDTALPVKVSPRVVAQKLGFDQFVFSPVTLSAFFMGMGLLEGKGTDDIKGDFKSKWIPTYKMDCTVWPAAQLINFAFLPSQYRVLYVSAVSVGWNTYLSRVQHREVDADGNPIEH